MFDEETMTERIGLTMGVTRTAAAAKKVCSPPPGAEELFQKRKDLIKQTWKIVEADPKSNITSAFYARLLDKYPDVRPMFQHTNMDAQANKLHEVLRVAIRFLDDTDDILPSLREMGIRHGRSYGVKRRHYRAVTEVFIEVLNEYLNEVLYPVLGEGTAIMQLDVAAAWSWILTLIGDAMADAAAKER